MGGPSPVAGAPSVVLPHGMDAPKYRPSPQPRSTAGVPREDGRIAASPTVCPCSPSRLLATSMQ